jgi:outer membrane protein assembly factor BamB
VWLQPGFDAGRSSNNTTESTLTTGNVGQLKNAGLATQLQPSVPVVGNDGTTFVQNAHDEIAAYDLSSCAHCFPKFYAFGSDLVAARDPSIAGDALITRFGATYDARGQTNCSGTPVVCAPIWTYEPAPPGDGSNGIDNPVVAGNRVYFLQDEFDGDVDFFSIVNYDANGQLGCSVATTGAKFCDQLGSVSFGVSRIGFTHVRRLAYASGRVLVVENDESPDAEHALFAVRDDGVDWIAHGNFVGDPVAAGGLVWVQRATGEIDAFDVVRGSNCNAQTLECPPRWSAITPATPTGYAAANNTLYVAANDGKVYAFDATGTNGCSGTPKHCAPIWSAVADPGANIYTPTIANGVVYTVGATGRFRAFDAAGVVNCSGAPKVCTPLRTGGIGAAATGPAIVAAGRVVIPRADELVVYRLP